MSEAVSDLVGYQSELLSSYHRNDGNNAGITLVNYTF